MKKKHNDLKDAERSHVSNVNKGHGKKAGKNITLWKILLLIYVLSMKMQVVIGEEKNY